MADMKANFDQSAAYNAVELHKRLLDFVKRVKKLVETVYKDYATVEFTEGERYYRVYRHYNGQNSVHCFVDKEDGSILKGSWKAPVKNGIRGNIWADDFGISALTPYGVAPVKRKGRNG